VRNLVKPAENLQAVTSRLIRSLLRTQFMQIEVTFQKGPSPAGKSPTSCTRRSDGQFFSKSPWWPDIEEVSGCAEVHPIEGPRCGAILAV